MKAFIKSVCTTLFLSSLSVQPVLAQGYPNRPVTLIVPYAAGGGTDILARKISEPLAEALGQPVIVQNKPGASANIGMDFVAKTAPDGYTLLLGDQTLAVNPSLIRNMPIRPMVDLKPVAMVARAPVVLIINPSLKINSLAELVQFAHAHPGQLTYASAGKGNTTHLCPEVFKLASASDILQIPYKGSGPALIDVVGGQVSMMCAGLSSAKAFIDSGRVKPLAIIGTKRAKNLPNVPTFEEAGYPTPELDNGSWWGILGPAALPENVLVRLDKAIAQVLARPELQQDLAALFIDVDYRPANKFAALIQAETQTWATVFRKANIKPE